MSKIEKCISILSKNEGEHIWKAHHQPKTILCGRCGLLVNCEKLAEQIIKIKEQQPQLAADFSNQLEPALQADIQRLKEKLYTERETARQALQTSQEWHERQKAEIIEQWTNKYQALINKWKTSLNQEITLLREILNHDQ